MGQVEWYQASFGDHLLILCGGKIIGCVKYTNKKYYPSYQIGSTSIYIEKCSSLEEAKDKCILALKELFTLGLTQLESIENENR
jgi:hypothetical protein